MTLFDKPAFDIEQQLDALRQRGLAIPDDARAKQYLANISYYRFSAYARPFYLPSRSEHIFLENTAFDDILHLYVFDRELRLLLLDAIERIEVALRAQLTNTLAEHYGPHGYLDAALFNTRYDHNWLINKLGNKVNTREIETFLSHYRNKYTAAPVQPPIWMAVELLSFKEVSILFENLRASKDTQRIESHFGWKFKLLTSWFRSISDLRNLCAHHSRVWNREFGSRPEMPKKIPVFWPAVPESISVSSQAHPMQTLNPRRRLYLQLVVIESLMRVVCPESHWAVRLIQLLDRYPQISRTHMGFTPDWNKEAFWSNAVNHKGDFKLNH